MEIKYMLGKIKTKYLNLPIQVRASFWFLVCTFTTKAVNVFTTPIFTRLLSTSEYGEYGVYSSWLSIFQVFISLNLSLGVFMRGLVKFKGEKYQFASSMQMLTFLLALGWLVLYLPFANIINGLTGLTTVRSSLLILTIWLTSIFGFWSAEQRVDYQYRKLVPVTILVAVLGQGLGVVLIHVFTDKVTARILGTVIIDFIFYVFLFVCDLIKGKVLFQKKYWSYALAFNIPLIPHYLSQTILNSSDRIMIDRMSGSNEAGIYTLAYSLAQVMTMFNMALAQTEEPWLYRKIDDKKVNDIKPIAYTSFVFIAVVNVLLIALAPEIIAIFAPVSYSNAIWVVPPIAMSVYFSFSYYFFAVFEYYYERTKPIALASCIGAVLNILLNYTFIPIFGYYAAGYTTLLCFMIYAFFHYVFMRKICNEMLEDEKPFDGKTYLLITVVFLVSGFVFQVTYVNRVIRYLLLSLLIIIMVVKSNFIINQLKMMSTLKKKKEG